MEYVINVMDLYIKIKCNYEPLTSRLKKYLVNDYNGDIDFDVSYEDDELLEASKRYKNLTIGDIEYILTGNIFYVKVLKYNAMLLHSSCVIVDNKAYMFSGNSKAGKSTHTSLYLKYIDGSYILNDDKPAIRIINDKVYVIGTPFSGKNDISENKKIELQGICFIKQDKINKIRKLSGVEAISKMLAQTLIEIPSKAKELLLDTLDKIVSKYDVYELSCDISKEACELSYNTMKGDK